MVEPSKLLTVCSLQKFDNLVHIVHFVVSFLEKVTGVSTVFSVMFSVLYLVSVVCNLFTAAVWLHTIRQPPPGKLVHHKTN